jgi:hypothetical protein
MLLFDRDYNASAFTGSSPFAGTPANSAYAVHPYYYVVHGSESQSKTN